MKAATEEPSLYTYPPTEHLLDDQEDHANLQRIIYSCLIKRAFSFKFKGKSMETETMMSECPNGGKSTEE